MEMEGWNHADDTPCGTIKGPTYILPAEWFSYCILINENLAIIGKKLRLEIRIKYKYGDDDVHRIMINNKLKNAPFTEKQRKAMQCITNTNKIIDILDGESYKRYWNLDRTTYNVLMLCMIPRRMVQYEEIIKRRNEVSEEKIDKAFADARDEDIMELDKIFEKLKQVEATMKAPTRYKPIFKITKPNNETGELEEVEDPEADRKVLQIIDEMNYRSKIGYVNCEFINDDFKPYNDNDSKNELISVGVDGKFYEIKPATPDECEPLYIRSTEDDDSGFSEESTKLKHQPIWDTENDNTETTHKSWFVNNGDKKENGGDDWAIEEDWNLF